MSVFLGIVAAFAWGIHDLFVKVLTKKFPAICGLFYVLGLSCGFLFLVLVWSGERIYFPRTDIIRIIFTGFAFALASLTLYKAFEIGPIKLVSPIIAGYPIVSVSAASFLGSDVKFEQWLAIFIVFFGICFIILWSDGHNKKLENNISLIWAFCSSISFAFCFSVGQSISFENKVILSNFLTRFWAFIIILIYVVITNSIKFPNKSIFSILIFIAILDTIAFASVITSGSFENAYFSQVGASTFGVITIILAWFFLHEKITSLQWMTFGFIFAALGYLSL